MTKMSCFYQVTTRQRRSTVTLGGWKPVDKKRFPNYAKAADHARELIMDHEINIITHEISIRHVHLHPARRAAMAIERTPEEKQRFDADMKRIADQTQKRTGNLQRGNLVGYLHQAITNLQNAINSAKVPSTVIVVEEKFVVPGDTHQRLHDVVEMLDELKKEVESIPQDKLFEANED